MSSRSGMTTRSATRSATRAGSDGSEPVDIASSIRSSRRRKPSVINRPTHTYGSSGQKQNTLAQQLMSHAATEATANRIGNVVEQAGQFGIRSAAGNLSVVVEEAPVDYGRIPELNQNYAREGQSRDVSERQSQPQSHAPSQAPSRAPSYSPNHAPSHLSSRAPGSYRPYRTNNVPARSHSAWGKVQAIMWMLVFAFMIFVVVFGGRVYYQWSPTIKYIQRGFISDSLAPWQVRNMTNSFERVHESIQAHYDSLTCDLREKVVLVKPEEPQINWLAIGQGAKVDALLTSPRAIYKKKPSLLDFIRKVLGDDQTRIHPWNWLPDDRRVPKLTGMPDRAGPPENALVPADERYCAPSTRGKLQLAATLARKISPTELIIKHEPKGSVMYIGTAPKEFELWIQILDSDLRAKIAREIIEIHPYILSSWASQEERFDPEKRAANKNWVPELRRLHPQQALDETWVPVGHWKYNIHSALSAQKFRTTSNLTRHGVAVDRVAIRINSNWGNTDHTCLMTTGLHGVDQSGIEEYLEEY